MSSVGPTHKSDIIMKDIGGEILLYSNDEKILHVLNSTAKLIWDLCDGAHSLEEIEQALRSRFSVPDDHGVEADIEKTLAVFASKGLLEENE